MPHCAVSACKHISSKNNLRNGGISYHRFPREPDVREKWRFATGRKLWFPTKLSTICSIHFKDNDFAVKASGNRYLKRGSIPTLDVWMNQSSIETKHVTEYKEDTTNENDTICNNTEYSPLNYKEKSKTDERIKRTHNENEGQSSKKKRRLNIEEIIIDYDNIDRFGEQIVFLLKRIPRKLCRELQGSIVTLVKTATKECESNIKNDSASTSNINHESPIVSNEHAPVEEITIKVEPFDVQIEYESTVNESIDDGHMHGQTELQDSNKTIPDPIIPVELIRNMDTENFDTLDNDKATNNDANITHSTFFHSSPFIKLEIEKDDVND